MIDILSVTPLEKFDFSFPSRYQLQITFWLVVEFVSSSTLNARIVSGFPCADLVHAVIVCEFTYVLVLLYMEDTASLESSITSES